MTTAISRQHSLSDIASIVSTALSAAGIDAVLTGGGAVSLYSDNVYQSYDLDFIATQTIVEVADALRPLGFARQSNDRHFTHPNTDFLVEFPTGPLSFGETIVDMADTNTVRTPLGTIRVITPTQAVMDRMAAYVHWHDNQSREQALLIARGNKLDWTTLFAWAENEGIDPTVIQKLKARATTPTK